MSPEAPKGPVDQEVRDWIVGSLDVSSLLEAGAGTGKTTVLIDRVMRLLTTEVPLDRIAIITFTEKAAGELKLRLRRRIEADIHRIGPQTAWRAHLRRSLEALDRASISTIHAFAASLLRERPVEAQVDPRFVVADETTARMLLEETWSRWCEKELAADSPVLERALRLGLSLDHLRRLAFAIVENRDVKKVSPPPPAPDLEVVRRGCVAAIREAAGLLESCRDPQDHGYQMVRALADRLTDLETAEGDDLLDLLSGLPLYGNKGAKGRWDPPEDLARIKEIMAAERARRDEAIRDARCVVVHEIQRWLREGFLHAYRTAKESRRMLDFTDLILICRNVLRDDPGARAAFQRRFDCILVDEFQDTDPLQSEILFLLAADDPKQSEWWRCRPMPGKLFLVGDPKQSIYRFRRADIEIYEMVKDLLPPPEGRDRPRLTQNFRSVPSILSWINDLFENLMVVEEGEHWQPHYEAIRAARVPPPPVASLGEGPVMRACLIAPRAPETLAEADVTTVRTEEARHVAAFIRRAVEEGWPVRDRDTEEFRPIAYGDVALLFHGGTAFEVYEEVLRDHGCPYRISGGRRYYLRAEIRALEAVLRAIESPHDPLAVVSALRCPVFGHTDEDLLAHRAAERPWTYTTEGAGRGTPFERDFALLAELHRQRNARPIVRTLEDLYDCTGALSLFRLKPDGEQRAANLLKACEIARAHDAMGGATFGSFVRWLSQMATEEREEGEAPLMEDAETVTADRASDAVRVSTVHKAKGLEFPMVILCDPAGRSRGGSFPVIIERGGDGPDAEPRMEFSLGTTDARYESAGFVAAAEREKRRQEAERIRLFYVAATRARDYLVIPHFSGKQKAGIWKMLEDQTFLPPLAPPSGSEDREGAEDRPDQHRGARVVDGASLDTAHPEVPPLLIGAREALPQDRALVLDKEGWRRALKEALSAPATGRAFRTASSLEGDPAPPGRPAAAARGDGTAKAVGVAVHGVLERIDLKTGRDIGLLCEEEADRIGRPDLAGEIRALVTRTLASDLIRTALAAPRLEREIPFAAAGDSWITEGRADLVFEEGGGLTIVDFKTDDVRTKEECAERAETYRPQALIYAQALHAITALPIRRVILHFVRPGIDHAFRVDEAFLAAGRRLLEHGSLEMGAREG